MSAPLDQSQGLELFLYQTFLEKHLETIPCAKKSCMMVSHASVCSFESRPDRCSLIRQNYGNAPQGSACITNASHRYDLVGLAKRHG